MGDIPQHGGASNKQSPDNGSGVPNLPLDRAQSQLGGYQSSPYPSAAHQNHAAAQQFGYQNQVELAHSQAAARDGSFNMSGIVGALPQQSYRHGGQYLQFHSQQQQRFNPQNPTPSNIANQLQQAHYGSQAGLSPLQNQQYYLPQHTAPIAQYYTAAMSPTPANVAPRANMGYYPSPLLPSSATTYYYPQPPYPTQSAQAMPTQLMAPQFLSSTPPQPDSRLAAAQPADHYGVSAFTQAQRPVGSPDSRSNIVRGPPRKPRQSGHAIWIGNLPGQTDLISLVNHVCKQAGGLDSLFLIGKSNCAFANFTSEAASLAAVQKVHDSRFESVRLVSRLRKQTVEGASGITAPTGPAAITAQSQPQPHPQPPLEPRQDSASSPMVDGAASPRAESSKVTGSTPPTLTSPTSTPGDKRLSSVPAPAAPQKDRFFVLKSLTVEDLNLSVQTGVWATQSHNEETLNKAFETAENVYLVFSANKSGEYFGYARMASPINTDPAAAIQLAPSAVAQTATDLDLPKVIPTEATEFAPKGRIIDDSARGTLFWEADREESNIAEENQQQQNDGTDGGGEHSGANSASDANSIKSGQEGSVRGTEGQTWGKPFQLKWLSTNKLPFYRTRGLRNPWNSNREVKIARDGTELEPTVGRNLIGLFNKVGHTHVPAAGAVVPGFMPVPMRPTYQG